VNRKPLKMRVNSHILFNVSPFTFNV